MATIDEVLDTAQATIISIGQFIDNLIDQVAGFINGLIDSVVNAVSGFVNSVIDTVTNVFTQIRDVLNDVFISVISSIENFINNTVNFIQGLINDVVNFISGLVDNAVALFNEIFNTIVDSVSSLFNTTVALFNDIVDAVVINIQNVVEDVRTFFGNLFNTVAEGINTVIDTAGNVVASITQAIEDFISSVVDVVGESLRELLETISDLPGTINELAISLIDSARENIKDPLDALPEGFVSNIIERITGEPLADAERINQAAMDIIFGTSPVTRSPDRLRELIQAVIPENIVGKAVLVPFVGLFVVMQVLSGIAQANSAIVLQEHALVNPYRIMEPPDVVRAVHFGLMEHETATELLRKTGYDEVTANDLIRVGDFIPPAGEVASWWLRDFIDDNEFNALLTRGGWSQTDIALFRQAVFFIPPVQDLITMAVREVFTPDVAREFGQFEDFPPDFVSFAKQQGVSEEWAQRYWGAHWSLPSVQMGFEMLHRGVITQAQLELLLRASDVMPFWRDKLVEISFSPLTRVDVRRMHKVGVLSEEEVNRAYLDLGYNETNAQRLTDFTVALNDDTPDEPDVALSELTRSNIINFFEDGLIGRAQAADLLQLIGISFEGADLFLTSSELELQRQERKGAIDLIIEQAKAGTISFEVAQDQLARLGLETGELERARLELQQQQARKNKLPPKGDLDKFWNARIINDAEYVETLGLLGFNELWADRYLQLIKGG